MNIEKRRLIIEQTDAKLANFKEVGDALPPPDGWIFTIRSTLRMTLRQLGRKMNISAQSVKEMEERERNGSVTLRTLSEAAEALNMKMTYVFLPKDQSVGKMIENRASELAREIVTRASASMKLEDQENSQERIEKAIALKTEELKNTLPKYLWD